MEGSGVPAVTATQGDQVRHDLTSSCPPPVSRRALARRLSTVAQQLGSTLCAVRETRHPHPNPTP